MIIINNSKYSRVVTMAQYETVETRKKADRALIQINERQKDAERKAKFAAMSPAEKGFHSVDNGESFIELEFGYLIEGYLEQEYSKEEAVEKAYENRVMIHKAMVDYPNKNPKQKRLTDTFMEHADRYRTNYYSEKAREHSEKVRDVFRNLIKSYKKNGLSTKAAIAEASKEAGASEDEYLQTYANTGAKLEELVESKTTMQEFSGQLFNLGLPFSARLLISFKCKPITTLFYLLGAFILFVCGPILLFNIYLV